MDNFCEQYLCVPNIQWHTYQNWISYIPFLVWNIYSHAATTTVYSIIFALLHLQTIWASLKFTQIKSLCFYIQNKCKRPPPPFSRPIVIPFIIYRSTTYYFIPLITIFFHDKMENVIMRFHCINLKKFTQF